MDSYLEILLVGTGPGVGLPVLYDNCWACTSKDPRDKRRESGALFKYQDTRVMIDAGRGVYQGLMDIEYLPGNEVIPIDFVAVTHIHFDHWGGIEELAQAYRRYLRGEKLVARPLKVFTHEYTWNEGIGKTWGFLTQPSRGGTRPSVLENLPATPGVAFNHDQLKITPYSVKHGTKGEVEGCLAYLIEIHGEKKRKVLVTGDLAPHKYWTNWEKDLPFTKEDGLDLVIIEANSWRPLPRTGHTCALEALEMVEYWQPRKAILTHISHEYQMRHGEIEKALEAEVKHWQLSSTEVMAGYDGMRILL